MESSEDDIDSENDDIVPIRAFVEINTENGKRIRMNSRYYCPDSVLYALKYIIQKKIIEWIVKNWINIVFIFIGN